MKRFLLAAALSTFAMSAQAATTFFYDEAGLIGFAGATNGTAGLMSENFETTGTSADTQTFGFGTVAETGGLNTIAFHMSVNMIGANPVADGEGAIWYHDNGTSLLTLTFNTAINALSFYIATDNSSNVNVSGNSGWSTTALSASSDPIFFGVVSDSLFTTVTLDAVGGPNVGIDLVKYGNTTATVPLPASGLLLLAGLGGLGLRRKLRARG